MKPETIIRHFFAGKLKYEDGSPITQESVSEMGTAHIRIYLIDCMKRYSKKSTLSKAGQS